MVKQKQEKVLKELTQEQKEKQALLMNILYELEIGDAVDLIKKEHLDLNYPYNQHGWTPFMYIVKEFFEVSIIKKFVELGGSLTQTNNNGETPLMIAAQKRSSGDIIRLLAKYGADVNTQDKWGFTPLMRVITHGQFAIRSDVAVALIENGADLTKLRNCQGKTAVELMFEKILNQ